MVRQRASDPSDTVLDADGPVQSSTNLSIETMYRFFWTRLEPVPTTMTTAADSLIHLVFILDRLPHLFGPLF
jgi:hypothetical protein